MLHHHLLERSRFVERALHSVEDGLLITSVTGRIAFANRRAAVILDTSEEALLSSDLFDCIRAAERGTGGGQQPASRERVPALDLVTALPASR